MKNKIDWELIRNHSSDLLTQDFILGSFYRYCNMSQYGASFRVPFVKYDHMSGDIFWARSQMEELRNLDLTNHQAEKLISDIRQSISNYKKYVREFKIKTLPNKTSLLIIKEWFNTSEKIIPLIAYFVFEESLAKRLNKESYSAQDLLSVKTDTTTLTDILTKLKSKFQKEILAGKPISSSFEKEIQRVVDKYAYLGMKYFGGAPWTKSDMYQMIVNSDSDIITHRTSVRKKSKTIGYLSELSRLRTVKWELMCYSTFLLRQYIKKFFGDFIRYEDLLKHSVKEVLQVIDGDYSALSVAHRNFVLIIDKNGYSLSGPKEIRIDSHIKSRKDIKGIIAYAGKVKGIAKIILSPKDSYKIKKGDILIATMSTPDFLPAMQRASAFVTDIGGITSHVAIVAREMKKPCIMGTKVATKTLKDGDFVEVDANKGVIRIIKK